MIEAVFLPIKFAEVDDVADYHQTCRNDIEQHAHKRSENKYFSLLGSGHKRNRFRYICRCELLFAIIGPNTPLPSASPYAVVGDGAGDVLMPCRLLGPNATCWHVRYCAAFGV